MPPTPFGDLAAALDADPAAEAAQRRYLADLAAGDTLAAMRRARGAWVGVVLSVAARRLGARVAAAAGRGREALAAWTPVTRVAAAAAATAATVGSVAAPAGGPAAASSPAEVAAAVASAAVREGRHPASA